MLARLGPSTAVALVLLVGCGEELPQSATPRASDTSQKTVATKSPDAAIDVQPVALLAQPEAKWNRFRGADGSAVSDESVPVEWSETKNLVWKVDLPGPGTSSPIILGDHVYVTCHTGYAMNEQEPGAMTDLVRHLVCVNRDDGSILWKCDLPADQPEGEYADRMHWHGYASSTPAADADRVYAFFGKSGVFAFDHQGEQVWHANVGTKTHEWGSAASIVLYENLVIVNAFVECGQLVAFDRTTGEEAWRAGDLTESWNTPALVTLPDGKTELVVGVMGKVLGFAPATGEELWTCDAVDWYVVGSIVSNDGILYCISGRDHGSIAIRAGGRGDVSDTHVVWRSPKGSNVSSPLYYDGHLYFAHESNAVAYCLEATKGEVVYEERLPGRGTEVYASPVVANGNLIYVRRQGGAHVLPAAPRYEELATNVFESDDSPFNGSPAIDRGRIYLRSNQALYCIGER